MILFRPPRYDGYRAFIELLLRSSQEVAGIIHGIFKESVWKIAARTGCSSVGSTYGAPSVRLAMFSAASRQRSGLFPAHVNSLVPPRGPVARSHPHCSAMR
jgi:hypothetical protein